VGGGGDRHLAQVGVGQVAGEGDQVGARGAADQHVAGGQAVGGEQHGVEGRLPLGGGGGIGKRGGGLGGDAVGGEGGGGDGGGGQGGRQGRGAVGDQLGFVEGHQAVAVGHRGVGGGRAAGGGCGGELVDVRAGQGVVEDDGERAAGRADDGDVAGQGRDRFQA